MEDIDIRTPIMANDQHDDILALLPAFALGSLEPAEAERVERHLAGCDGCRAELAVYESVVGLLALAAPEVEPVPALKDRLLARIEPQQPPAPVPAPVPVAGPSPAPGLGRRIASALSDLLTGPRWRGARWRPALALLILVLLAGNVLLWQQLRAGQSDHGWQQIHLYGSDSARGIIYISADGRNGTLVVDGLPPLPPDQQYQLWLIHDGQRASGAVFSVDADGYRGLEIESAAPLDQFNAFGITIEPAGGSPAPTGERVLGYNLSS
jgi:anti-sigma factor RsiW